jgi:uncharacterized protein YdeI (YjbR/CyaY-like superfamily)
MPSVDNRIDVYIEKAASFAQPILTHLRQLVHKACPEIEETIKWSFPVFQLNGIVCNMASFKEHCAFGFWKAALMDDPKGLLQVAERAAMGHLGNIRSLKDLPSDKVMIAFIKQAVQLNKDGMKLPAKPTKTKAVALDVPADLQKALNKNKAAKTVFAAFSNTNRKEYIEWIEEAKTDATRQKRLDTAIEWMAEGKIKNWKYVKR